MKTSIKNVLFLLDNISTKESELYHRTKNDILDMKNTYTENKKNIKKFKKYKKIVKKLKEENKTLLKFLKKLEKKLVKSIDMTEESSSKRKNIEKHFKLLIKIQKGEEI